MTNGIRRACWLIDAEKSVAESDGERDAALLAALPLTPEPGEVLTVPWYGFTETLLPALETPSGPRFRRAVAEIAVAALNTAFRACEASYYAVWVENDVVRVDWHRSSLSDYEPTIIRPEAGRYALGERL